MHPKIVTLAAAALLTGSSAVGMAQSATGTSNSASKYAPGHLQKHPGQARNYAPGHRQKHPGQASRFAPGHEKTTGTGTLHR